MVLLVVVVVVVVTVVVSFAACVVSIAMASSVTTEAVEDSSFVDSVISVVGTPVVIQSAQLYV